MAYIKRICKAGNTIDVMKSTFYSCVMQKGKLVKAKREKVGNKTPEAVKKYNQIVREREITRIANANFRKGDWYITLKYAKEERPTVEGARKHKSQFLRVLRELFYREGKKIKYIFTTEIGERGGIHHHMLLCYADILKVQDLWKKVTKGSGNLHFELTYGMDLSNLAKYFVGERCSSMTKGENTKEKRYSCSQGLKRPTPSKPKWIEATSWREEPVAIKGYYIDKNSLYEGVNPVTGRGYQFYRMVKLWEADNTKEKKRKTGGVK